MNVFLWIVQGVLAAAFAASGVVKIAKPRSPDLPLLVVRLIGAAESAAAVALIVPAALDFATVLTPLAATGLAVLMVLAMGYHARRKESVPIAINAVLLILAALVMWGRFGSHAF
ncbi:DoxX family protein [Streptomyces sp. NPDC001393]